MLRPKRHSKTWPKNNPLEPSEAGKYFCICLLFCPFYPRHKVFDADIQHLCDFDRSFGRRGASQLYALTDIREAKTALLRKIRPIDSLIF